MEIHQIRYFLAVERERNFSRAAESCNITQPALTRAIQRLEEELRGPLLERRPGHVELTELGRNLMPRFEQALAALTEAKALARSLLSERKQRLRLGMMCTLGTNVLAMMVSSLVEACPEVDLTLTEARGAAIVTQLLMDEIDVALVGLPRYPPAVDVQPLYSEVYAVMMSRDHRFANGDRVAMRDLEGETYVERINCEFEAHFEDIHGAFPVEVNVKFRSEREDCVQALVASGLGVAIIPQSLDMRTDLISRALVDPSVARTVSLVTVRERVLPPPVCILKQLASRMAF